MRVYLDLDGVLANFDAGYRALFGWTPNHDLTDEQWETIHAQEDFFFNLPLYEGAVKLFLNLPRAVNILTACPKSHYGSVARQKRRWVQKHFGDYVTVLPVMGSHNKPLFMHAPGDLLIDDYGKNCREWSAAGGIAIKHEAVDDTIWQFKEHYHG